MNERDIELAKKCGYWSGETIEMNDVGIKTFADLIRADQREACAKLCDEARAARLAEQIRARGNT